MLREGSKMSYEYLIDDVADSNRENPQLKFVASVEIFASAEICHLK